MRVVKLKIHSNVCPLKNTNSITYYLIPLAIIPLLTRYVTVKSHYFFVRVTISNLWCFWWPPQHVGKKVMLFLFPDFYDIAGVRKSRQNPDKFSLYCYSTRNLVKFPCDNNKNCTAEEIKKKLALLIGLFNNILNACL